MLTKCFGIVSWFPTREPDRSQRQERLNRLLKQLNGLWPEYPILIISQNWLDFEPIKITNEIIRVDFKDGLGILKARKTLRREFLKLKYDYLIMLDDDAIIKTVNNEAKDNFMKEIDKHKNGFSFIRQDSSIDKKAEANYALAQLNLCAISRYILSKEDIPDVDPQKEDAYEDLLYSNLLHVKYSDKEFLSAPGIKCTQFLNPNESAPSTWANWRVNQNKIYKNSEELLNFLYKNKDLPNLDLFKRYHILVRKEANQATVQMLIDIAERKERNQKKSKWVSVI